MVVAAAQPIAISSTTVALNDDTGTFQNSWPGPGRIALLQPNSDVSVAWTKSGSSPAGTNFGGVDDVPNSGNHPDDGVTYNSISANSTVDRLGLTDLPVAVTSGSDIILTDTYGRLGSDGSTGQASMTFRLWDQAGVSTDGPAINARVNGWKVVTESEHQVFDAGTRSNTDINAFNAGYVTTNGTNPKNITVLWVNVEWTEVVASPQPKLTQEDYLFENASSMK